MAVAAAARRRRERTAARGHPPGRAALLATWARRVDLDDRAAFTAFYQRVWRLFFAEYPSSRSPSCIPRERPRLIQRKAEALVLQGRLQGLRPLDQPVVLDGPDARRGARAGAPGPRRPRRRRRRRGHRVLHGGHRPPRGARARDDGRPEPDQLARARRKPALAAVAKQLGDAEDLPLETDRYDRYVSTGSIEYRPDPQRAIAEAYRVLRPGGVAMLAGPLARSHPLARRLSDTWMLFSPSASTATGSRGPASRRSGTITSRPTGGATAGTPTPWRSAA